MIGNIGVVGSSVLKTLPVVSSLFCISRVSFYDHTTTTTTTTVLAQLDYIAILIRQL